MKRQPPLYFNMEMLSFHRPMTVSATTMVTKGMLSKGYIHGCNALARAPINLGLAGPNAFQVGSTSNILHRAASPPWHGRIR